MKYDIITLFPAQMEAITNESILKRGQVDGKFEIKIHDLRKYTEDKRKTVDDRPFGGGPGMLMMIEPIYKALKDLHALPSDANKPHVILTAAGGQTWNQQLAQKYSTEHEHILIICGHYEGVDHRISEHLVDAEISIGNYVLTGGELAAGVIIDSTARLIPGVLGNENSLKEESHTSADKEYPQYTRPAEFITDAGEIWKVPEILLSGHHAEIKKWQDQLSQK